MTPEEQRCWEAEQILFPVDFSRCFIDPTPFQIVERTSLVKVHGLFSMMRIDLSFVTNLGRLEGMVTLEGLKQAISDVKSGKLKAHDLEIPLKRRSRTPDRQKVKQKDEEGEDGGEEEKTDKKQKKAEVKEKKKEEKEKKKEEKEEARKTKTKK